MKIYDRAEQRRITKERAYHVACVAQYREAASKLTNESRALKAMDNAQFHERKLAEVDADIARFA